MKTCDFDKVFCDSQPVPQSEVQANAVGEQIKALSASPAALTGSLSFRRKPLRSLTYQSSLLRGTLQSDDNDKDKDSNNDVEESSAAVEGAAFIQSGEREMKDGKDSLTFTEAVAVKDELSESEKKVIKSFAVDDSEAAEIESDILNALHSSATVLGQKRGGGKGLDMVRVNAELHGASTTTATTTTPPTPTLTSRSIVFGGVNELSLGPSSTMRYRLNVGLEINSPQNFITRIGTAASAATDGNVNSAGESCTSLDVFIHHRCCPSLSRGKSGCDISDAVPLPTARPVKLLPIFRNDFSTDERYTSIALSLSSSRL